MGIQKLNNKGLQLSKAFFAILIAGMVLTSFGILYTGWVDYYGGTSSYDLEGFNQNDEVLGTSEDIQDRLTPENANPGENFESTTFTGAFGVINQMFSSFRFVFGEDGLLDAAATKFGIPAYLISGIMAMMIIAIAMAIVAIVFRLTRSSA